VVVVDNGSVDGTAQLLRRLAQDAPRLELVCNPRNAGFAAACNQGMRLARESRILLLNPDAVLQAGALAALAEGFDRYPQAGILGLKVYDWDGATVQLSCRSFPDHRTALFHRYALLSRLAPRNRWSRGYLATDFDHQQVRGFDWVSGCAMAVRRELIEQLGGFDEQFFMYCEDVDLCRRARQAGHEVLYLPAASARHRIGGSSRSVPALVIRERHRSMWRYYRKHLRGGVLLDLLTLTGITLRCLWQLAAARAWRTPRPAADLPPEAAMQSEAVGPATPRLERLR
jgi:GT2 family glycosyltransferase